MLGTLLDQRYKVTGVLGAGGFGQTFLAQDTRRPGHPQCVVKQLKPLSADPELLQVARRLFNTEAEMLEKLGRHDRIPQLLAYFEENQEFYLVQEFIAGHPLSQELQPGVPRPPAQVISILGDILTALEFVHFHQVIHRDIKPSNLIRRRQDGHLVLIDFGAVKEMHTQMVGVRSQQLGFTVGIGTQGYMPSEQVAGRPRFNSDLYAAGMIGIQALTGLEPMQLPVDPHTGEVLWQHLAPQVPPPLGQIVTRMVLANAHHRYQSVQEVLQDLSPLSAGAIATLIPPTQSLLPTQSQPTQSQPNLVSDTPAIAPVTVTSRPLPLGLVLGALGGAIGAGAIALLVLAPEFGIFEAENPEPGPLPAETASTSSPPISSPEEIPSPPVAPAPAVEWVTFAPGSTETVLSHRITPNDPQGYRLQAGAAQELTVQVLEGEVRLRILDPQGQFLGTVTPDSQIWQRILPLQGTYALEVITDEPTDYAIRVAIAPPPASAMPNSPSFPVSRVNFAPGATGSILSDRLETDQGRRYLLNCRAGQQIQIDVLEGAVTLALISPEGQVLGTSRQTWQGKLPTSGDYTLEVVGTSASEFAISIDVS